MIASSNLEDFLSNLEERHIHIKDAYLADLKIDEDHHAKLVNLALIPNV